MIEECAYEVEIWHERTEPVKLNFALRGYMLCVDLSRFDGAGRPLRLLGFGHSRLHNFRRKDFSLIADARQGAHDAAVEYLRQNSGIRADRVFLLANPAICGYIFNPVSFFFCYLGGNFVATIVEVNNTFGEQKHFILPAEVPGATEKKNFYVSPFISPLADFKMRIVAPTDRLSVGIHTVSGRGTELKAELSGRSLKLSDAALLKLFLRYPVHTLRVIVLIHWYALKLFFRGVPHYVKANADAAVMHANLRRKS